MKVAILFLGLVAMCQGLYIKDDKVNELIDLLKKAYDHNDKGTQSPRKLTRTYSPGDPMATRDPATFDLDHLFEFPGSDFLTEMIEKNFSDPAPMHFEGMSDFRDDWRSHFEAYTSYLEPRWLSTAAMFVGDHTGLSHFYTMKITRWLADFRFACPSAFFDKIFSRWSFKKLEEALKDEDDSLFSYFFDQLTIQFPDYSEQERTDMASGAVRETHGWIVHEMMQHVFGYGFIDLAKFMHTLFWKFDNFFSDMRYTPFTPEMMSRFPFGEMVKTAFMESDVKCEAGIMVLHRYSMVVNDFKTGYEESTVAEIAQEVEPYLWDIVKPEDWANTTIRPEVVEAISDRIREYMDSILEEFSVFEKSLMPVASPDFKPLQEFMETILDPTEVPMIWNLFERLGFNRGAFEDSEDSDK